MTEAIEILEILDLIAAAQDKQEAIAQQKAKWEARLSEMELALFGDLEQAYEEGRLS